VHLKQTQESITVFKNLTCKCAVEFCFHIEPDEVHPTVRKFRKLNMVSSSEVMTTIEI